MPVALTSLLIAGALLAAWKEADNELPGRHALGTAQAESAEAAEVGAEVVLDLGLAAAGDNHLLSDLAWHRLDEYADLGGVGSDHDRSDPPGLVHLPPWTHDHVVDALRDQPVLTRRIIFCEVGRSGRYNPYAVGSLGEIGPAQLLPGRGNGLSIFYSWGGVDPHSPYDAVWFVNEVTRRGMIGSQYPRTSRGCAGSP